LHVVADDVGGAVDVRHRGHGGEVELLVTDTAADVALGLHEVAGGPSSEAAWHPTMVRGAVHPTDRRRMSSRCRRCHCAGAVPAPSACASARLISLATDSTTDTP